MSWRWNPNHISPSLRSPHISRCCRSLGTALSPSPHGELWGQRGGRGWAVPQGQCWSLGGSVGPPGVAPLC